MEGCCKRPSPARTPITHSRFPVNPAARPASWRMSYIRSAVRATIHPCGFGGRQRFQKNRPHPPELAVGTNTSTTFHEPACCKVCGFFLGLFPIAQATLEERGWSTQTTIHSPRVGRRPYRRVRHRKKCAVKLTPGFRSNPTNQAFPPRADLPRDAARPSSPNPSRAVVAGSGTLDDFSNVARSCLVGLPYRVTE
jgi:hypothetical protein